MDILGFLKEDGFNPKRVAWTNGGEYASPCPFCGGKDRFRVWPNREVGGFFWCRQCGRSGNSVKYLLQFRGVRQEEIANLGKELLNQTTSYESIKTALTKTALNAEWEQRAKEVIDSAEEYLWRSCCVNVRSWLMDERGLNETTIKKARLGWTPQDVFMSREDWGLPPEKKEDGKHLKVWIPHGLIISFINDGHIQRIRVRRNSSDPTSKYYIVPGSRYLTFSGKGTNRYNIFRP